MTSDMAVSQSACNMYYTLARKYAVDMIGYVSIVQDIKDKLENQCYSRDDYLDVEHCNSVIRCNRVIRFLSKKLSFDVIGELGRGHFGVVELVALKGDLNSVFALKNIFIPKRKGLQLQFTKNIIEKDCLWECDNHDHVLPLIASWVEYGNPNKPDSICLLSDFMGHGDLNSVIKQLFPMTACGQDRRNFKGLYRKSRQEFFRQHSDREKRKFKVTLMETECSIILENTDTNDNYMQIIVKYFHTLLKAVDYLHSKDIVHRDIKPANILINDQLDIKLSDFGMVTPFKFIHDTRLYGWMSDATLSSEQYKGLIEFKDIEYQRNAFRQHRNAYGRATEIIGTTSYMAPEYVVPDFLWEEILHYPKPHIKKRKHFPTDWYALGCVLSGLCNGLHPIIDSLGFYSPPESAIERNSILNSIRINHSVNTPLLNGETSISKIAYRDVRILEVIRGLLHPHPEKRFTGARIMNSKRFQDLLSQYTNADEPIMSYWNRYVLSEQKSKAQRLLDDFKFKTPKEETSLNIETHGTHKIPETVIFPMSTTFLNTFSFSKVSPLTKEDEASGGYEYEDSKEYYGELDTGFKDTYRTEYSTGIQNSCSIKGFFESESPDCELSHEPKSFDNSSSDDFDVLLSVPEDQNNFFLDDHDATEEACASVRSSFPGTLSKRWKGTAFFDARGESEVPGEYGGHERQRQAFAAFGESNAKRNENKEQDINICVSVGAPAAPRESVQLRTHPSSSSSSEVTNIQIDTSTTSITLSVANENRNENSNPSVARRHFETTEDENE